MPNEAGCQIVVFFSGLKEQIMLSAPPIRLACDALHKRGTPIRTAELRHVRLGRTADPPYRFRRGTESVDRDSVDTSWSANVV